MLEIGILFLFLGGAELLASDWIGAKLEKFVTEVVPEILKLLER